MRWADPQTSAVSEINGNLNTWDLSASFERANPYFRLGAVVARFAEVLRASPYAGGVSLYQLADLAKRLCVDLPENSDAAEFADLVFRAAKND